MSFFSKATIGSSVVIAMAGASWSRASSAADAPDNPAVGGEIAEIIVTAEKRSESIQKVPLSITAISGDKLAATGVSDLLSLGESVPSVNIAQQPQGIRVTIRGIGNDSITVGEESPIAYNQDGVFIARTAAATSELFDINRVEVLRGPQGTLYGRNATGGAINVLSRDPTDTPEGYLNVTGGTYNTFATEGALSGPLSDMVSGRIAFRTSSRDGFFENIATGDRIDNENSQSVRGKLEIKPSNRTTIILAADYSQKNDNSNGWHYLGQYAGTQASGALLGGVLPPNYENISNEIDPRQIIHAWGLEATGTYDFDFATFKSITAYRRTEQQQLQDLDGTSFPLFSPETQHQVGRQFSQEFQLAGRRNQTDWLLGAYDFIEHLDGDNYSRVWNGTYDAQGYYSGSGLNTDAEAFFAQATQHVTDQWSVTLGGRYSTERKVAVNNVSFDLVDPASNVGFFNAVYGDECSTRVQTAPNCVPSARWGSFTPKAGIEFQATSATLLFASATKGFRSGNYPLGTPGRPVGPETIWAYELGTKSRFFDGRLQLNVSGFFYNYSDLQVQKVDGLQTLTENAASAQDKGLEAEIIAKPLRDIQVDFSGSYVNAKFKSYISADPARPDGDGHTVDNGVPAFNLAGNQLPQSPKGSFLSGAQYRLNTDVGSVTLRGEVSYTSRVFFTAFNVPELSVGSKTRFNAFLNYTSDSKLWDVRVIGRNLANKVTPTNAFVTTALVGYVIDGNIEEPRTVKFTIGRNF